MTGRGRPPGRSLHLVPVLDDDDRFFELLGRPGICCDCGARLEPLMLWRCPRCEERRERAKRARPAA